MSKIFKTVELLNDKYRKDHAALSAKYYAEPNVYPGGPTQFQIDHAALWTRYDEDMIYNSYAAEVSE